MCVVKKPKVQNTAPAEKQPIIIRNTYLDGQDPVSKALRKGRSSLRIERTAPGSAAALPSPQSPSQLPGVAVVPTTTPRTEFASGGGQFSSGGRYVSRV